MILTCEQRSEEWYAARLGIPTASSFNKIVTTKGEPSNQAQKYLYRLVGERLTGSLEETYQSEAMQRGVELEAEARKVYCLKTGNDVQEVGFVQHDTLQAGASPDGIVGEDTILEIKCPSLAVMIQYLVDARLPMDYFQQVQGQLFITGRKYCHFFAYYPGIRPLYLEVQRDESFITALEKELAAFCQQLDEYTEKLK